MPKQKHSREQSSLQLGDFKHFFPTKTHGINEISISSITHNTSISEQETWHALFKISCKRHQNQHTPHTLTNREKTTSIIKVSHQKSSK